MNKPSDAGLQGKPGDYFGSKATGETIILDMVSKGLPGVIVNPGTVIGPHDYGPSLLANALISFFNRKVPILMEGLSDYADARDIAAGMIAASEKGRIGERYFLTGEMLSMQDIPSLIKKITGKNLPQATIPVKWMYRLLPLMTILAKISGQRPFFTRDMLHASQSNPVVSNQKAKEELGFDPRGIEAAFTATFEWYRQMGWISY
jgi:dihydroflavonol-4-reductase